MKIFNKPIEGNLEKFLLIATLLVVLFSGFYLGERYGVDDHVYSKGFSSGYKAGWYKSEFRYSDAGLYLDWIPPDELEIHSKKFLELIKELKAE